LRQAIIILAIIVLMVFAYKYTRNILSIRAAKEQLISLQREVDRVKQRKEEVDEAFIQSVSPAKVDEVAKKELGWVLPGDTVYVSVSGGEDTTGETTQAAVANPRGQGEGQGPPQPYWRQWWALLAGE
jgi:cell division protein FtsB